MVGATSSDGFSVSIVRPAFIVNAVDEYRDSNWTTRGYANSRNANSRTGHLADWSTRGLDKSRTGQLEVSQMPP